MAGTDFSIHSSLQARLSGAGAVPNKGMSVPVKVAMIEMDGDARASGGQTVLAKYHTLVHEDETADTGIIVLWAGALITEAVVQDSVAAIIRLRTKGASPATFSDLTFTTADAIGVFRQFLTTSSLAAKELPVSHDTTTSEAEDQTIMHVPAGYGLEVALVTAGVDGTAGNTTGRALVMVNYIVVPRRITENQ